CSEHYCMHDASSLYHNDLSLPSLSQRCSFHVAPCDLATPLAHHYRCFLCLSHPTLSLCNCRYHFLASAYGEGCSPATIVTIASLFHNWYGRIGVGRRGPIPPVVSTIVESKDLMRSSTFLPVPKE
ncbi:hypothetical protein GW17_00022810, partial [Ensete ventricosum]